MTGSVVTSSFVMAAVGAFYLLEGRHEQYARIFLKVGVIAGSSPRCSSSFHRDLHGKYLARHQPPPSRHGGPLPYEVGADSC